MKKILFLPGFFATGSCPMARALKEAFEETAVVLTPDLPLHPKEALKEIRFIIDREQPDLLLGNSCGSFLAQKMMMDFSAKEERFFQHFKGGKYKFIPFSLRLRDPGAHGGLSGSLWRPSLLGSPRKDVLRESNEGRQNF